MVTEYPDPTIYTNMKGTMYDNLRVPPLQSILIQKWFGTTTFTLIGREEQPKAATFCEPTGRKFWWLRRLSPYNLDLDIWDNAA